MDGMKRIRSRETRKGVPWRRWMSGEVPVCVGRARGRDARGRTRRQGRDASIVIRPVPDRPAVFDDLERLERWPRMQTTSDP
jgi:hypothetical protein